MSRVGSFTWGFRGALLAVMLLPVALFPQIEIEITEVPYREPYAFLGVYFDVNGLQPVVKEGVTLEAPVTSFGLRMMSARPRDVQLEWVVGFTKTDISEHGVPGLTSLGGFEVLMGGRFYPRYPAFGLGRSLAVRLMGGAAGGMSMLMSSGTGGFSMDIMLTAGLAFSGRDDPSGLTLEVAYRPNTYSVEYSRYNWDTYTDENYTLSASPFWALRVGFLFAPG